MKKFIISSDTLKPALKKLGLAINTKSVLPVLSNIYVKVTKGEVELITSDLELTISYKCTAETKDPFEMLLPFDFFQKLIHLFKSSPVVIELIDKKKAVITGDNEDYNLNSLADLKAFPELPTLPVKNVIKLNDEFTELLTTAMITVSTNDMQPGLLSACFDMQAKKSFLVSTDSYVLYKHEVPVTSKEPEQLCISPKMAAAMDGLKDIEISWTKEKMAVKSERMIIWSTRMEAKFPNYNVVIPDYDANLKINKEQLADALNKACLSSSATKHTNLYLKREPGKIHIEFDDPDFERKGHLVVTGDYTGDVELVGINAKKLLTVLKQVSGDEINLHIHNADKAVLISADEDKDYLGLIMPLLPNKTNGKP